MEAELKLLLEEIRAELGKRSHKPEILTLKMAAHEMSVGLTKLKQMIASGHVLTVDLGGRKMVPLSEIHRLAAGTSVVGLPQSTPRPKRPRKTASLLDEAAKIDAALRKR